MGELPINIDARTSPPRCFNLQMALSRLPERGGGGGWRGPPAPPTLRRRAQSAYRLYGGMASGNVRPTPRRLLGYLGAILVYSGDRSFFVMANRLGRRPFNGRLRQIILDPVNVMRNNLTSVAKTHTFSAARAGHFQRPPFCSDVRANHFGAW